MKRQTDTQLCRRCVRDLEQVIGEFPALLRELDVTIARQDRRTGTPLYATRPGRVQIPGVHYEEGTLTLPSTPWPFSWDAAELRWVVESTVTFWASRFLPDRKPGPVCSACAHPSCVGRREADRLRALFGKSPGLLLLDQVGELERHPEAVEIIDQIMHIRQQLQRAIDRQTPDVFAGMCEACDVLVDIDDTGVTPRIVACNTELYAHKGDEEVRCPKCARVYDLAPRLASLRKRLDDEWARPQQIADALTTLEEPINASTLRQWIKRDELLAKRLKRTGEPAPYPLILQVGVDDDGRPLYRVGDVRARIDHSRGRAEPVRSRKRTRKQRRAS